MNFTNPWLFAAGVACLAIPVWVHLQRRRQPRRVVFSTNRFIDPSELSTRKKRSIQDWPLFLLRCLAVLFLALVFSKIFFPGMTATPKPQREAIALVFDRSASMQAKSGGSTVFDAAKKLADQALDETGHGSQVAILFAPPNQADEPVRWVRPAEAKRALVDATAANQAGDLAVSIQKAAQSLGRFGTDYPKIIHVVSDLQLSAIEKLDQLSLPPNVTLRVAKAGELEPSNGGFQIGARGQGVLRTGVYRHSQPSGVVTVVDTPDGEASEERLAKRELALAGGQTALALPYTAGDQFGWFARTITLPGEDAWPSDDRAFDAFYVPQSLPVLLIEPKSTAKSFLRKTFFLARALSPENFSEDIPMQFELQQGMPISAAADLLALTQSDTSRGLVVLPDEANLSAGGATALKQFVSSGGGLLVFGGPGLRASELNASLDELLPVTLGDVEALESGARLEAVSARHPLWGELSAEHRRRLRKLPLTYRHSVTARDGASTLASFADRMPFIVEKSHGAGRVIFVNASADRSWGKWQTDGALFVVTAHLLAVRAAGQVESQWRNATTQGSTGQSLLLTLPDSSAGKVFSLNEKSFTANAENQLAVDLPDVPGVYRLTDAEGALVQLVAVNLPPEESDLAAVQGIVVQRQLEKLRQSSEGESAAFLKTDTESDSSVVWRTILAILAILLAAEPLISNRYHAIVTNTK
jgi:hypothetical protein